MQPFQSSELFVLKFVTKMALYQPRRAVIATVLANFMQADFAEEFAGLPQTRKEEVVDTKERRERDVSISHL